MLNRFFRVLLGVIIITVDCVGQDYDQGTGYQMMMMNNPALAGIEGDGLLRLSYMNFYPGNNYNLHSVYLSYDSYFSTLHGGAGFYLSDEYLGGIINDLKGGVSYAYFLQAGEDLFINAGLSASFYYRGYNFNDAILPDQIDPLGGVTLPSSEMLAKTGQAVFDIGAGFVFIYSRFFGGLSISHLAEPSLSEISYSDERLRRKLLVHLSTEFSISKSKDIKIKPVSYFSAQNSFFTAGAGAVVENNYLSVNTVIFEDSGKNTNIQTGFSFNTGKLRIYYNYHFNIISGNKLLPFSLLHQTGLAISLYPVNKRNIIKTIKFPKM
jgi:type IX secretion system PorP/SprF family membrane protein